MWPGWSRGRWACQGCGAGAGRGSEGSFFRPSSHTCTLWRALALEPGLAAQVLGLLLEKISRDVPFKESRAFLLSSTPDRVATLLPLAVSGGWAGTHHPLCPPSWAQEVMRGHMATARGPHGEPGLRLAGTWWLMGTLEPVSCEPRLIKSPQV